MSIRISGIGAFENDRDRERGGRAWGFSGKEAAAGFCGALKGIVSR
jgi:hypothetical protein